MKSCFGLRYFKTSDAQNDHQMLNDFRPLAELRKVVYKWDGSMYGKTSKGQSADRQHLKLHIDPLKVYCDLKSLQHYVIVSIR